MPGLMKHNLRKSNTGALILLCWFVYSVSYLGKVNYSANINGIIDYYNVSKAEAGIAPTFFFFAYGIGQVVNGLFCKRYNIKWVIFGGLMVSALINLFIAACSEFTVIKWLWPVNGFALSILWPTLIRLLSQSLPQKDLSKSSAIMGTTVASGTLAIYGLSSVYSFFSDFKLSFYTAAFAEIIVAVFWLFLYKKFVITAKNGRKKEYNEKENKLNVTEKVNNTQDEKHLFYISVCVLCFCAIGVNLIKDGLITWSPAILKEEYSVSNWLSILLTVFLPVVAVFGNLFALKVHKKIPDYVMHCAIAFVVIFAFTGVIICALTFKHIVIMLASLIIVNFLASSLNSLITSIFPMFMRNRLNSGLYAGILNGFCYLGSAISSYGLGAVADNFGWKMIFYFLMALSIIVCFICCGYICLKQSKKNCEIN